MSTVCVREAISSLHIYEYEVARRWFALPVGVRLPLNNGDSCRLLFTGHAGGAAGPDVQDVVLHFSAHDTPSVGDVEFHVRSSDWFAHQHHTDRRYNNVLLHVVLICDHVAPLLRQDGSQLPLCSLYDVVPSDYRSTAPWPCQDVTLSRSDEERGRRLMQAGLLRFEQKAHAFVEHIHQTLHQEAFSAYDVCLIAALAEGLGYGRDRAFFRAIGRYLLGQTRDLPEPLGRASAPSPLDAQRLAILRRLVEQWRVSGVWNAIREILRRIDGTPEGVGTAFTDGLCGDPHGEPIRTRRGGRGWDEGMGPFGYPGRPGVERLVAQRMTRATQASPPRGPTTPAPTDEGALHSLRAIFADLGRARADILICNIVLPFAMAVALIENDALLAEQAQRLYVEHPGLSSNRITRAMCRQLLLAREPRGACQQQGLHYIYQQTCKEKRCEVCMLGERLL